jgi:hypothetical protein
VEGFGWVQMMPSHLPPANRAVRAHAAAMYIGGSLSGREGVSGDGVDEDDDIRSVTHAIEPSTLHTKGLRPCLCVNGW